MKCNGYTVTSSGWLLLTSPHERIATAFDRTKESAIALCPHVKMVGLQSTVATYIKSTRAFLLLLLLVVTHHTLPQLSYRYLTSNPFSLHILLSFATNPQTLRWCPRSLRNLRVDWYPDSQQLRSNNNAKNR